MDLLKIFIWVGVVFFALGVFLNIYYNKKFMEMYIRGMESEFESPNFSHDLLKESEKRKFWRWVSYLSGMFLATVTFLSVIR